MRMFIVFLYFQVCLHLCQQCHIHYTFLCVRMCGWKCLVFLCVLIYLQAAYFVCSCVRQSCLQCVLYIQGTWVSTVMYQWTISNTSHQGVPELTENLKVVIFLQQVGFSHYMGSVRHPKKFEPILTFLNGPPSQFNL